MIKHKNEFISESISSFRLTLWRRRQYTIILIFVSLTNVLKHIPQILKNRHESVSNTGTTSMSFLKLLSTLMCRCPCGVDVRDFAW